jgi:hypothetical protein
MRPAMNITNFKRVMRGLLYLSPALTFIIAFSSISANAQLTPRISVTPVSLKFRSLKPGVTSTVKTVTVKNTGKLELVIGRLSFTGEDAPDFGQTNTCNTPVPPGGACTISVIFTPAIPLGNKHATLNVDSNDPIEPTFHVKVKCRSRAKWGPSATHKHHGGRE